MENTNMQDGNEEYALDISALDAILDKSDTILKVQNTILLSLISEKVPACDYDHEYESELNEIEEGIDEIEELIS